MLKEFFEHMQHDMEYYFRHLKKRDAAGSSAAQSRETCELARGSPVASLLVPVAMRERSLSLSCWPMKSSRKITRWQCWSWKGRCRCRNLDRTSTGSVLANGVRTIFGDDLANQRSLILNEAHRDYGKLGDQFNDLLV